MRGATRVWIISVIMLLAVIVTVLRAQDGDFHEGDEVIVQGKTLVLYIYSEADPDSDVLEATVSGLTLTILGGPEGVEDVEWWQVRSISGTEGWIPSRVDDNVSIALSESNNTETSPSLATLETSDEATITTDTFVLVYAEPNSTSQVLEALIGGVPVTVIAEPETIERTTWWQIRSPSSIEGWVQDSVEGQSTLSFGNSSVTSVGLESGQNAIIYTDSFVVMYAETDATSQAIEALVSGIEVSILSDSEELDQQVWWEIRSPSGNEGWILESVDGEIVIYPEGFAPEPTATPTLTPTIVPTPTPASILCPGTLPTRLRVAVLARVTPGLSNNLRNQPSLSGERIGQIPSGNVFTVMDGPQCADNYAWWQVDYNGTVGWVAEADNEEYWLEQLTDSRNVRLLSNGTGLSTGATVTNGEMQVEYYCSRRGYTIDHDNNDWFCVNNGSRVLTFQSSDFDAICRETYDIANAFALQNGSGELPAFRWRCYEEIDGQTDTTSSVTPTQSSEVTNSNAQLANSTQCSGSIPQRLSVGIQARQILNEDPVRVQNEPGGGTTLFFLYPNNVAEVIGGPQCQNIDGSPASWWQVRGVNDWVGWVVEGVNGQYYLEPVSP